MSFFNVLRNKTIQTLVSLFVAVQTMNICVDPVDHHTGSQDTSINEIESCIEFIVEVVMGEEHAISESDETDYSTSFRTAGIILFLPTQLEMNTGAPYTFVPVQLTAHSYMRLKSLALPITSPPPRALS
jgi:hypothetical protein